MRCAETQLVQLLPLLLTVALLRETVLMTPTILLCSAVFCLSSHDTQQQNGVVLKEGEWVSINGTTGEVVKGKQPVKKPGLTGDLATFMKWVDAKRRLRVLTNADTPEDAKVIICWFGLLLLMDGNCGRCISGILSRPGV